MKSFLFAVLAVVVVSLVADSTFAGNFSRSRGFGNCNQNRGFDNCNQNRNRGFNGPAVEVQAGRFGRTRVFVR